MALPKFLQPYLAGYDLRYLDSEKDRELIITQILNRGDDEALRWLSRNYSRNEIKQVVFSPTRGMWLRSILSYWLKIFGLKLDKKVFNQAIIDLNKF